jgi:O-antigen/teichoic acid export membrane protein
LIGSLSGQTCTLLSSVFAARTLGRETFGHFSFLMSTVTTAAAFAGFGLGLTATRYVARYREEDPQVAASFIRFVTAISAGLSGLAGTLMLMAAPHMASDVFHRSQLTPSVRLAAVSVFCLTVNGVQTGVLSGFERFRSVASVNAVRGASTLLATVALVPAWELEGAVAAVGLGGVLACILSVLQIASAKKAYAVPTRAPFDWRHAKLLWSFSLPAVLAGIVVSPVTWLASLWLARAPNGYAELGLFGAANQWRSALALIPTTLMQPLLPVLTSLTRASRKSFGLLVLLSIALNGVAAAGVGVVLVCAVPLISTLYGRSFTGLNDVMIPLMIAGVISCAAAPVGHALASEEKVWIGVGLNTIWGGCLLGVAAFTVADAGAQGLAYSFLAANILHMFTSGYYLIHLRRSGRGVDGDTQICTAAADFREGLPRPAFAPDGMEDTHFPHRS